MIEFTITENLFRSIWHHLPYTAAGAASTPEPIDNSDIYQYVQ